MTLEVAPWHHPSGAVVPAYLALRATLADARLLASGAPAFSPSAYLRRRLEEEHRLWQERVLRLQPPGSLSPLRCAPLP